MSIHFFIAEINQILHHIAHMEFLKPQKPLAQILSIIIDVSRAANQYQVYKQIYVAQIRSSLILLILEQLLRLQQIINAKQSLLQLVLLQNSYTIILIAYTHVN